MSANALTDNVLRLPVRLDQSPVEEAVFEIRFAPSRAGVADLLPGLVFSKLGTTYHRSEAQPLASLPAEFRSMQPELRYQAQYRLSGETASIFVGEAVAGIGLVSPYEGWQSFRPRILELLNTLRESNLLKVIERASLKYVNLFPTSGPDQLAKLRLSVLVAGSPAPEVGFKLRVELNDAKFIRIVEIAPNVRLQSPQRRAKAGLLVDIDCITVAVQDFWSHQETVLEGLHSEAKRVFFELVAPEALKELGPHYE